MNTNAPKTSKTKGIEIAEGKICENKLENIGEYII